MIKDLDLERNKKYIVGVSGGSDSMGLLSMLVNQKFDIVVCAVNYKLRENADKEEKIVKDYCENHNVKCYVDYPKQTNKDNFQKWARDVRYDFYYQTMIKENCDCLLLAHQKDDHIENYIMALERNSHGWYYGINKESFHHNMHIIRPLLDYRKSEIRNYCLNNDVPYSDDESNFSDKYARNRVRHHIVEPADDKQIEKYCIQIEQFNKKQKELLNQFNEKYPNKEIELENYKREDNRKILLRYLLYRNNPEASYSSDFIDEIDRQIISSNKNFIVDVAINEVLVCEYGLIYLSKKKDDYCYKINLLDYQIYDKFQLTNKGKTIQGLNVQEKDFPLIIRNCKDGDLINLRYGHKKVNRILIDKKIPYKDRIKWLVIENKDGEVIFVENIGCDVNHYSTNMNLYVLKS